MWIVGNEHLSFGSDIEFTANTGKMLAQKLEPFEADCLIAPEVKALGIAYETARTLGTMGFAVARKSIKPYQENYLSTEIRSITTGQSETLYIDDINIDLIQGKKVILLDDVISTGSTMLGLIDLVRQANAEVCALASVWLEGPWPFETFSKEIQSGRLIYLDVFPIFAEGNTYNDLCERKRFIENKF